MRRPITLLAAAVAVLASCSSDDAATPALTVETIVTTTTAAAATTEPDAALETTTTTVVPTASVASTIAATSTSTPAPTTTTPDHEQIRADVAAAVVASWEALDEFVRNPKSAASSQALKKLMTNDEYSGVFETVIVGYVVNDLAERTNPEVSATITPYPDTLTLDMATGAASMEFCFVSTNLLVQVQADGSEVLQDDRIGLVLGDDTFTLLDGEWIDSGGSTFEVIEGETSCPDR